LRGGPNAAPLPDSGEKRLGNTPADGHGPERRVPQDATGFKKIPRTMRNQGREREKGPSRIKKGKSTWGGLVGARSPLEGVWTEESKGERGESLLDPGMQSNNMLGCWLIKRKTGKQGDRALL